MDIYFAKKEILYYFCDIKDFEVTFYPKDSNQKESDKIWLRKKTIIIYHIYSYHDLCQD
jgi:hypothetical protein